MRKIKQHIDRQMATNKGKNLFFTGLDSSMRFIRQAMQLIDEIQELDTEHEDLLLDYVTEKALQEFWRVNQYYTFDKESREALRTIYINLLASIKNLPVDATDQRMNRLGRQHYENLKAWLGNTNAFAEKAYREHGELVDDVPCSEYSPQLQMEVLRLNPDQIMQPILDIGCGRTAQLAQHLHDMGLKVQGIDRDSVDVGFCQTFDWMEYKFKENSWGTIISHLSFANHFKHHHFRVDGNFLGYASKYMEILSSLKPGGSFYYVPDLPFIEGFLDNEKFEVQKHPVESFDFTSVKIQKLKN